MKSKLRFVKKALPLFVSIIFLMASCGQADKTMEEQTQSSNALLETDNEQQQIHPSENLSTPVNFGEYEIYLNMDSFDFNDEMGIQAVDTLCDFIDFQLEVQKSENKYILSAKFIFDPEEYTLEDKINNYLVKQEDTYWYWYDSNVVIIFDPESIEIVSLDFGLPANYSISHLSMSSKDNTFTLIYKDSSTKDYIISIASTEGILFLQTLSTTQPHIVDLNNEAAMVRFAGTDNEYLLIEYEKQKLVSINGSPLALSDTYVLTKDNINTDTLNYVGDFVLSTYDGGEVGRLHLEDEYIDRYVTEQGIDEAYIEIVGGDPVAVLQVNHIRCSLNYGSGDVNIQRFYTPDMLVTGYTAVSNDGLYEVTRAAEVMSYGAFFETVVHNTVTDEINYIAYSNGNEFITFGSGSQFIYAGLDGTTVYDAATQEIISRPVVYGTRHGVAYDAEKDLYIVVTTHGTEENTMHDFIQIKLNLVKSTGEVIKTIDTNVFDTSTKYGLSIRPIGVELDGEGNATVRGWDEEGDNQISRSIYYWD